MPVSQCQQRNPTPSFVFQVFQCQARTARKEKELCAWGAGNGSHPWCQMGVSEYGVYMVGISIQWQFHRNKDDKTWDLGFFSDKPITPYYSIYSKYSCDCDPPPEMYRCIMNYTYNPKERGSAVRTLIDERKMTFLWICSLYDRGLTFWSSQAHISDVVLVGPATMGLEAKKRRGCRFMKDTKAVQKC